MATTKYNIILYVDTAAGFAADETVYGENDLLLTSDTGVFKKGDGVHAYADLTSIGTALSWSGITDKPAVIAAGATAAAAWGVIQSGAIGITATKAAAGNHDHAIAADAASGLAAAANIQELAIALSTRIAAAGNHDHAIAADTASGLAAAATIQDLAVALSARIKTLEDAAV